MGSNIIDIEYKNKSGDKLGCSDLVYEMIKGVLETASNGIIVNAKLTLTTSDSTDKTNNDDCNIYVNRMSMDVLNIHCKSASSAGNLLQYLDTIYELGVRMNKEMYDKFRSKFTLLCIEAFGNSVHSGWSYDTDEINKLLSVRNIGYRVIRFNDGFYTVGLQIPPKNMISNKPNALNMSDSSTLHKHIVLLNEIHEKLKKYIDKFYSKYAGIQFGREEFGNLVDGVINIIQNNDTNSISEYVMYDSNWINMLLNIHNVGYSISLINVNPEVYEIHYNMKRLRGEYNNEENSGTDRPFYFDIN